MHSFRRNGELHYGPSNTRETGNFSGVEYGLLGWGGPSASLFGDKAMAVEWTTAIEGRNEFARRARKAIRIDKSWECRFDGDLGPSIEDSYPTARMWKEALSAGHDFASRPLPTERGFRRAGAPDPEKSSRPDQELLSSGDRKRFSRKERGSLRAAGVARHSPETVQPRCTSPARLASTL